MTETYMIERSAVIVYSLLQQLHEVLSDPEAPDQVTLGILLGTAMFCDDQVGPFRSQKLMQEAPGIVLKSDAHVKAETTQQFAPILRVFGEHLQSVMTPESNRPAHPEMSLV
jgi:hypothetical protein